jgi:hypothetical protein
MFIWGGEKGMTLLDVILPARSFNRIILKFTGLLILIELLLV